MRGYIEYKSKTKGDCPTDISLSGLDEDEVKFLKWSAELQSTIADLNLSIIYYNKLFDKAYNYSRKKKSKCFLMHYMTALCTMISIGFGKLCSNANDLSLKHYISYCKRHNNIFDENISSIFDKAEDCYIGLSELYNKKISGSRNKIYGHSDKELLNDKKTDGYVDDVSIDDMIEMLEMSKEIVSSIWYAYNHHDMCFEFKNQNDYRKILLLI